MRRQDKAVTDRQQIDAIIRDSLVCRLALAQGNRPYLVPVSFGYDGQALYLHTATTGTKIEFFLANPQVCFEFERHVEVRRYPELACKWTLAYESVIGFGVLSELVTPTDKEHALNEIMRHYSGQTWTFDPTTMTKTRAWKITIQSLTGKRSPSKSL